MTVTDTVSADGVRVRVRPWRGRTETAECAVLPAGALVPPGLLHGALDRAEEHGFDTVVTPALPRFEWRPYLDVGFTVREHLHLLTHDLLDVPASSRRHRHRRALRHDRRRVLQVDHAAFDEFWRLDAESLEEAMRATPSVRFRVASDGTGYSLIGRAGDRGYVQRLAVIPEAQGAGLGSALVVDGLRWLKRRRVHQALVNTQTGNERAVELYERLGFRRRDDGLGVLQIDLHGRR